MSTLKDHWLNSARELLPRIELRRRIHRRPELGLYLPETTRAVREALHGLDVEIAEGAVEQRPHRNGAWRARAEPSCCAGTWTHCPCLRTPAWNSARKFPDACMPADTMRTRPCSPWRRICCTPTAGCMVFLGAAPDSANATHAHACHSSRMVIDEQTLMRGIALHAAIAERFLAGP